MQKTKLIYDILGILNGGTAGITDDTNITPRQVSYWIDTTRALLIRRDIDKGKLINPNVVQHVCIDVELVDQSECPECIESGCYMYKSTQQIPKAVEASTGILITRIGPVLLNKSGFNRCDFARFPYLNNKYKHQTWYAIKDGYVYLKTSDFKTCILVSLIAEEPESLVAYLDADRQPCYSEDSDYPVSMHMVEEMKSIILKNNSLILQTKADQVNDSADIDEKAS